MHDKEMILTPLADNGNLRQVFEIMNKPMPEPVLRFVFDSLLKALTHSHGLNCAHRDLNLENILVDDNFDLQIADWGLASTGSAWRTDIVGNQDKNPPEMMEYIQLTLELQICLKDEVAYPSMHVNLKNILGNCSSGFNVQEIPFCWFVDHLDTEVDLDLQIQKNFFTKKFPGCMEGNLAT